MPKGHVIGLGKGVAARLLKLKGWQVGERSQHLRNKATATELEREGITVDLGHALSWKARIYPSWLLSVLVFLGIHGY